MSLLAAAGRFQGRLVLTHRDYLLDLVRTPCWPRSSCCWCARAGIPSCSPTACWHRC
ncbi:hypothetical protein ACFQZC_27745 [Streptacidiphilus monticola]